MSLSSVLITHNFSSRIMYIDESFPHCQHFGVLSWLTRNTYIGYFSVEVSMLLTGLELTKLDSCSYCHLMCYFGILTSKGTYPFVQVHACPYLQYLNCYISLVYVVCCTYLVLACMASLLHLF